MAERKPNRTDYTADQMTAHTVQVIRYGESVRKGMFGQLYNLADKIKGKLGRVNLVTTPINRQAKRQRELFSTIKDVITEGMAAARDVLITGLEGLAKVEATFGNLLVSRIFGGKADVKKVTEEDAIAAIKDMPVTGIPAGDWVQKSANDLNLRSQQQVRLGVVAGDNTSQIAQRIIGAETGKTVTIEDGDEKVILPELTGGVLQITGNEISNLVRTATVTASATVLQEVFDANEDLFHAEQWMAHLDQVTCLQCAGLDGGVWGADGNPLPESPVQIKLPGRPAIHPSCRCFLVPVARSADELELSNLDLETRNSLDGKVAVSITFERWLRSKPEAFQRDVLGPGKWRLWKGGKLTLQDMLDPKGNALALKALKQRLGIAEE